MVLQGNPVFFQKERKNIEKGGRISGLVKSRIPVRISGMIFSKKIRRKRRKPIREVMQITLLTASGPVFIFKVLAGLLHIPANFRRNFFQRIAGGGFQN
jgi:hypothetical protein